MIVRSLELAQIKGRAIPEESKELTQRTQRPEHRGHREKNRKLGARKSKK
jgi:predicted trehalose synthase